MKRRDFVKLVQQELTDVQTSIIALERIQGAILNVIIKQLITTGEIRLDSLGTFKLVRKAGGPATNLKTGEKIMVPPRMVVRFKPQRDLKKLVAALPVE